MPETATKKPTGKYIAAVGRRKSSVAQVRLFDKGKGEITINDKPMKEYVPELDLRQIILSPLKLVDMKDKVNISVIVTGGGKRGQSESIRLGIARALEKKDAELRKTLKVAGYLMRDSRVKERKKPGLKRARRAPQWSKR